MLTGINAVRANLGLHGYVLNSYLMATAQAHSEWMAATGIVSHDENGAGPAARAHAAGYGGSRVSENVYSGFNATAQDALNWWIGSPIHYSGIVHAEKNEIGIGIASDGRLTYYTLMFGRSGNTAPPPQEESAPPTESPPDAPAQAAAAPTQPPPPTRPPITFTPSPTIPSQTPTITWTPTFTWTPSPTETLVPPTSTPLVFQAANPLPTVTPTPTTMLVALAPLREPSQPNVSDVTIDSNEDGDFTFSWRMLLPVLIVIQVTGLGWVLRRLWKG